MQACAAAEPGGLFGSGGAAGDDGSASTTAGAGGDGGASTSATTSGGGGEGPCIYATDCASYTDACNTGACVNGVCAKLPANDFGGCDDGVYCTENDTCQAGECVGGTPRICPSTSDCTIGTCDLASDACVEVPANDGTSCVDDDPCTITSTCSAGQCVPGQLTDCSFLNGTCSVGVCDPQLGCIKQSQNDGTACDDGLYCTINDKCTAGACAGDPNTCAPPGDICLIGTCDEASNTCVAVPGNNGSACDDGNDCTINSTCSNGSCVGGVAGNNGMLCDDDDLCTTGTKCAAGVCGSPAGQISQCINADGCCPAGCQNVDDDCMDLSGVFAQFSSENRNVYMWKTPPCAPLPNYTTFCQDRGLKWWAPKSAADAQQLITFAYNLDLNHTWIQVYGSVQTNVAGQVGGYNVVVDGPGCVEGSSSGWTAFRKWACSFCDPESNAQQSDDNQSCCWDKGHAYDWFVCED
jgi:hypothetical protein